MRSTINAKTERFKLAEEVKHKINLIRRDLRTKKTYQEIQYDLNSAYAKVHKSFESAR